MRELLVVAAAALLAAAAFLGSGGSAPSLVADPARTPGVVNTDVTQDTIGSTICREGWTRTIRPPTSYTSDLKVKQMREYGVTGRPEDFQEDHLISLELGGHPTDPRNLWPEPIERAERVDRIENELNAKVCAGRLTLVEAQRQESELKHRDG